MKRRMKWMFVAWLVVLGLFLHGQEAWDNAEELYPGFKHLFQERKEPRIMKINVIRIDLTTPGLYFEATPRAPEWGTKMEPVEGQREMIIRTVRRRTRDFLMDARSEGHNMQVAANCNGWEPWCPPWNQKHGCNLGLIVSDGVLVSELNRCPSFVVYKDGRITMEVVKQEAIEHINLAVTGFAKILEDGKNIAGDKSKHPRMGYGLSKDCKYMYIMAIDGRQPGYSEGATTIELAEYLSEFGAWNALNMDGGGSTTLVSWDEKAKAIRKFNHHKGNVERTVGANLGICVKQAK